VPWLFGLGRPDPDAGDPRFGHSRVGRASARSSPDSPASPMCARQSPIARCSADPNAASHSSPVTRPRRSRLTSSAWRPPSCAPIRRLSNPLRETEPRCRSPPQTSTFLPGAASSSSSALGSRASGQECGSAFQNSSQGASGSAVAACRTAARASLTPRQRATPPAGISAASVRWVCTSTNPGRMWCPDASTCASAVGNGSPGPPIRPMTPFSTSNHAARGTHSSPAQIVASVTSRLVAPWCTAWGMRSMCKSSFTVGRAAASTRGRRSSTTSARCRTGCVAAAPSITCAAARNRVRRVGDERSTGRVGPAQVS
jgi:hypothetical protein